MNVAPVLPVSQPSQSTPSAAAVAVFGAHTPAGQPGAFSSLLDGLVNDSEESFLAGTTEEQPTDLPDSKTTPVAAKGKGKDTKSGKSNSSPKPGLVQAPTAPPPPIVKPSMLFRSGNWETYSQTAETAGSETPVEVAAGGKATSISINPNPSGTSPIPAETESASTERIAFGLRLTTSNPETGPATGSRNQEPQSMREAAPLLAREPKETPDGVASTMVASTQESSHPGERFSAPPLSQQNAEVDRPSQEISADHVASKVSTPSNNEAELAAESSPTSVPDAPVSADAGDHHLDDATNSRPWTETGSAGSFNPAPVASRPVASGPVTASSEYAVKQRGSDGSIPTGERDDKRVPDLRANSAPVSISSGSFAHSQAVNLQTLDLQSLPEEAGKPQTVSGNSSKNTPGDQSGATPFGTPAQERVIPLWVQQQQTPAEKSSNSGPAPNAKPSQTGAKQDLSEPSRNAGRENAGTAEPQAQSPQASGGPDTRAGRTGADPSRPTPSRATQSQSTPSPAIPSLTNSSQTTPIQAATSEARASEAPKVANEPEINTAPQAQPARQISLKLTGDDSSKVTVDLSERAGKVQVSVRTADPELAKSLRGDLGDLVGRLESKGFKTEAWVPTASRHTPAAAPEQSGSSNSQSGERQGGSGTDQRQGRQGQNGSNQRQQARWKAQIEETLSTEETRTNTE